MPQTRASQPLPQLYTAAQVRALDRAAIDGHGIPGIVLMQRAGRAVWKLISDRYPTRAPLHIVCGIGNNGGDGYIVARLAAERGVAVDVRVVGDVTRIKGDAQLAFNAMRAAGVDALPFDSATRFDEGIIVDALLGTGLNGSVRVEHAAAIDAINASALPVVAVDIPSGLCSDTGSVLGVAVRASHTVTFIGRKRGLFTGAANACCGEVHFDDLAVPAAIYADMHAEAELLQSAALLPLPRRARDAHKGHFGHVLVIGGDHGMGGAVAMAAEAAARCGAGLVSVATRPENVAAIVARCPVIMVRGIDYAHELEPLLARATVVVIGPGLGRGAWGQQLLRRALPAALPTVLDADALNELAEFGAEGNRANWLITPHPGEAARLLGISTAAVNRDRFAAIKALRDAYPGAVVLKGSGTLVASGTPSGGSIGVSPYGNPGMAGGGMGDVLSGVLGALLAQGLSLDASARCGVCLHAMAADLAVAREGERGLLATDLLPSLRRLVNAAAAEAAGED